LVNLRCRSHASTFSVSDPLFLMKCPRRYSNCPHDSSDGSRSLAMGFKIRILPAFGTFPNPAAQERFCQHWKACVAIRRKCWPTLTHTHTHTHTPTHTHTHTLSLWRIAFLQTAHLMSLTLSVLLPWQQLTAQGYSCAQQILHQNSLFTHTAQSCRLGALPPPVAPVAHSVAHCYWRAELELQTSATQNYMRITTWEICLK